jgi:membrane-associated protein
MEQFLNPEFLINSFGYLGIFSVIFLESGFFFAFFLPGDTLIFTVGFLASASILNIWVSWVGLVLSTFFGGLVGYLFGKRVGDKIFFKRGSFLFDPRNLERTKVFYKKYGEWAVAFCRFVPVVRTFVPILAGVGQMKLKTFLKFNILGSFLWPTVVISVGYFFGSQLPMIHQYVMPVILCCFLATFIPIFWAMCKKRKEPITYL